MRSERNEPWWYKAAWEKRIWLENRCYWARQFDHKYAEQIKLWSRRTWTASEEEPKSLEHAIFRSIESLKLKKRRKGTWFTFEHLNELKIVLEKFPENHSLIKKALRISTASFKRLKGEWASLIIRDILNKREEISKCCLNELQKVYVKHFVKPPTIPLTLNEI